MIYQFEKDPASEVILVYIQLDKVYQMKMVLDTAASRTTFDINALLLDGYPIGQILETAMVETSNGKVDVDVIETKSISAFGHTVLGMNVQIYDFFKHGILSDYHGLLGLDFFENTEFRINMKNQTIEVI
jgi:hypothetical protein